MGLFSGRGWDDPGWMEGINFCSGQNENKIASYSLPGSSPSGSRVIQRGDRVSVRGKNLFNYRYKERLEKNSVVGKLVEKRD